MSRETDIVDIYLAGVDAETIAAHYNLSSRQVQRIVKSAGASRTQSESYNLAIAQGRMTYIRKPKHLLKHRLTLSKAIRWRILERDSFRCVVCGCTAADCHRLEVDHIDENPSNNTLDNLQTLCDSCNKGKSYNARTIG